MPRGQLPQSSTLLCCMWAAHRDRLQLQVRQRLCGVHIHLAMRSRAADVHNDGSARQEHKQRNHGAVARHQNVGGIEHGGLHLQLHICRRSMHVCSASRHSHRSVLWHACHISCTLLWRSSQHSEHLEHTRAEQHKQCEAMQLQ